MTSNTGENVGSDDTKDCPFCAETIKAKALFCRFCGKSLPAEGVSVMANPLDQMGITRSDSPAPGTKIPDTRSPAPKPQQNGNQNVTWGSFVVIALIFGGGYFGFHLPNSATDSEGVPSIAQGILTPAQRNVTYKVSGTASSVQLTYQTPQNGTSQVTVSLPWQHDETFKDGDFTYISAQNQGNTGSVTTQILIDGAPWKTTTSSGPYVIANSTGSVAKP